MNDQKLKKNNSNSDVNHVSDARSNYSTEQLLKNKSANETDWLKRITVACAIGAVILGINGLLRAVFNIDFFSYMKYNYIHMAPDTSVAFLFFGIFLLFIKRNQWENWRLYIFLLINTIIAFYGFLKFFEIIVGIDLTFADFLFPIKEKVGIYPVNRMSPITGALFCFTGVIFYFKANPFGIKLNRYFQFALEIFIAAAGFITTTGYLFGTPFFYGGEIIPLAATTSLGFLLLGFGIITSEGKNSFILGPLIGNSTAALLLRTFIPLTAIAVLVEGMLFDFFITHTSSNRAIISVVITLALIIVTSITIVSIVSRVIVSTIENAKKALKDSELKYRRLHDSITDAFASIDMNGRYIEFNSVYRNMLGYTEEELYKLTYRDITPEKWVHLETEIVKSQILKRGYSDVYEKEYIRKDGTTLPVELRTYLIRDDAGEPMFMWAIVRDISERKMVEQALRDSEERYRVMATNLPDIILVCKEGKIIYVNQTGLDLLEYSEEEILGHRITDFVADHGKEKVEKHFKDILSSDKNDENYIDYEIDTISKNGARKTVVVRAASIRFEKQPAILVVFRDITEQRRLQNQLIQSQKMESIGTLAGGIAHDFNNHLSIIIGQTSLLELEAIEYKRLSSALERIRKAADRSAALVRQLLTFARRTEVVFESVRVNEIILELVKLIQETFSKLIILTTHLDEKLPSITGDPTQIHQVLLNLLVNARDAMPKGGNLTITTDTVPIQHVQQYFMNADAPEYVRISITDSGVGMDEMTKSRIFEPFFTTKDRSKGTGLGLAVVFGIIRSHHGFIDVQSEIGKGTTFTIYLPVQLSVIRDIKPEVKIDKQALLGKEIILLVEDEEMLRSIIQSAMEENGYRVFAAPDGEEAVKLFIEHQHEIDLVVSDYGLPKKNGYQVFTELKGMNPDVKLILASGFMEPEIKAEIHRSGIKSFISKPFLPEELLLLVREVIDSGDSSSGSDIFVKN